MYKAIYAKSGDALIFEIRICVLCCRDMVLNKTNYKRVWLNESQTFIYSHEVCPPTKQQEDIKRLN